MMSGLSVRSKCLQDKPPGSAGMYLGNAMDVLLKRNNNMTMNGWVDASVREEIQNNKRPKTEKMKTSK